MTRTIRIASIIALAATLGCEDPARPVPEESGGGGALIVDSDPRGGRILVFGEETGEITPATIVDLPAGGALVSVVLDTAAFTYSFQDFTTITEGADVTVSMPLTLRCTTPQCLRNASEFHAAGDVRFAINGAGPLFLFEGLDQGITWPLTTSNSYASIGMASLAGLVEGAPVSLGIRNVGTAPNFWAGRPLPTVVDENPYRVRIPAWITPPGSTTQTRIRGIEIVHEVSADPVLANVLHVHVTWTNISADSLYRQLDPASPAAGVTYSDVRVAFLLDADVGPFGESDDDLVSYSVERGLVFAYDRDFAVNGFSGGWSDEPGLVGLMLVEGPGVAPRLNAWPKSIDFLAGVTDDNGRVLIDAEQTTPGNHPDTRIGYAPDDEDADYILSAAAGPLNLAPGASVSAHFAVLLAAPVAGTFTSGTPMNAGNPTDAGRPLAATAARLFALADSVIASSQ